VTNNTTQKHTICSVQQILELSASLLQTQLEKYTQCFLQEPQGVTSYNMAFFVITAVKTSSFTNEDFL
jgi:hypothetical protein